MSEHNREYRELTEQVTRRDRDAIEGHWELGQLFARYGEPVTDIAGAIGRGVTFVADHVRIAQAIPAREDLAAVLADRDDITTWTVLVDWVRAAGPGQADGSEPDAPEVSRRRRQGGGQQGGIVLIVPAVVIKGLADLGANPREALALFWQNASPHLIVSVAYPDRASAV